jgi:hypothetical protein
VISLSPSFWKPLGAAQQPGVDRGRGVSALRDHPQRLFRGIAVVDAEVEDPRGIERVLLRVERVAAVFDEHDPVLRQERRVVEGRMRDVALVRRA